MKKYKKEIKQLLGEELELYEKFHNATKVKEFEEIDLKDWPDSWKTVFFKAYARFPEIKLPIPKLPNTSLKKVLFDRKSTRKFSKKQLDINILSSLLYYSAGLKSHKLNQNANRFYPSGGSRYPLEIYIYPLNANLQQGIYHYYVKNNSLEQLPEVDQNEFLRCFHHEWVKNAGCIIIVTAAFKRNTVKYSNRGYRFVLTEVGLLAQNIYLLSTALKIGCCAVGGYKENKLEEILDISDSDESVVGAFIIGNSE